MIRSAPKFLGVLALAAPALGLAACGGGGESANGASAGTAADRAELSFARCMRRQGVDVPDPGGSGDTVRIRIPRGVTPKRLEAAHRACGKHLEGPAGGGARPSDDPRLRDQALRFAQCMRRNGVDIPDPKFEGGGVILKIQPGPGAGTDTSRFREAERRCRRFAPEPEGGGGSGATPGDPAVAEGPSGG